MPLGLNLYVLLHFSFAVAGSVVVLMLGDAGAPLPEVAGPAALLLWSLLTLGGILERRRWALVLELVRLAAAPVLLAVWLDGSPWQWTAVITAVATTAVSATWLSMYRVEFFGTSGQESFAGTSVPRGS